MQRKESSDDDLVLSKLKEKLKSPSKKKLSSSNKKVGGIVKYGAV